MKPARVKNRLFGQVDMRRLPSIGSDHFPMFIKLAYSPSQECAQEGLESTAEEEQWVDEKITAEPVGSVNALRG